ncbi:MAG: hypothetical protein RLZZ630_122, partial [Bacteroidota bacterium]
DPASNTTIIVPELPGSYDLVMTDPNGCTSAQILHLPVNLCDTQTVLTVLMLVEGFNKGNGALEPVLFNAGLSTDSTACDSVIIQLRDTASFTVVHQANGLLRTDGSVVVGFPASVFASPYFIAVRTRNGLETWSKAPVFMRAHTFLHLRD